LTEFQSIHVKKGIIHLGSVFTTVIGFIFLIGCQHNDIASYFSQDNDGWKVIGDAQGESAMPDYHDKDGNPGGYISANDNIAGGVWYWSAPDKFLGNKSSVYGKKLSFSLKQSSTENQFDDDDIILFGASMRIVFNTPNNPETKWTDYSIALDEQAGWTYNDIHGDLVSKTDLKKVLRDLTAIQIRGEYVTGEDTGGLDNFILHTGHVRKNHKI
jgi:hypothetical protein